jgi:hypothetical protein
MTYNPQPIASTDELKLFALIQRDVAILRVREIDGEALPPVTKSPEARAKIALAMKGNQNRRLKPASPPAQPRRADHG